MKKASCAILAFLLTGFVPYAAVDEQTMRMSSVDFLRAVIPDLLADPAIAAYFPGVHPDDVTLDETKNAPRATGWIYRWGYRHDVHDVPNPNREAQMVFVPSFDCTHGIVFALFVSCDNGSANVGRIKNYYVRGNPNLEVGLDLETGDNNAPLAKIDAIIQAHLARFRKAVGVSDPLSGKALTPRPDNSPSAQ